MTSFLASRLGPLCMIGKASNFFVLLGAADKLDWYLGVSCYRALKRFCSQDSFGLLLTSGCW
jgi:hypothetical protein